MQTFAQLEAQTLAMRARIAQVMGLFAGRERLAPPTWKNNALWHAGHLVITPRLLTFGVAGKPLGIDENYRKWFGKGSSPADWEGQTLPAPDALRRLLVEDMRQVFAAIRGREDEPYAKPYATSVGVTLATPAESLSFSLFHDGIHFGMLMAIKRELGI